ncbi:MULTISPECIES: LptF/LptG family permease [Cyanophyceae]|uniref:LptF/LptG family permease n=1 Tax=Cyanophyceae TaxID=3028117 RepID=UPI00232D72D5|nr:MULTISPECIES: LptF/LptG family permease [Cyanophyceae]MDB9356852.1 LptF/LptG family permease [Nodularia spumigena CS-587/03]MDB9340610.1 LptF/LptG family permease [Nodularia spumigena CS-589/07]MDB9347713.1 LptF/LptG family permease [Nodularia spumigena CS-588/01]MDB9352133.1 LptF/LptG family permease [Nodularia spumigena CS-588/05]MDB9400926.1 LptF/LptG family permease [Microcystis aeruginosa CS-567/02-A1]
MKKNPIFPQLSLLERYLISELIPPLLFSIVIVTIVAESIGVSFEQFKFLIERHLSFELLIYLHILKLPEFIVLALPIAILMATIFTYKKLSNTSEIIALKSCGINLYKLVYPAVIISILLIPILFIFNEVVVPNANYKAAITLENAMNINRLNFKRYDIFYKELDSENNYLKYLLYAEKFTHGQMQEVTLLIKNSKKIRVIINSKLAECYGQQKFCYFYEGVKNIINADGSYGERIKFDTMPLYLPNIALQLQIDQETLDNREMNIFQVYQRLLVFQKAGDRRNFRSLQVNIQERFTLPVSCAVFALLGSAIGINLQPRTRYNSFSLTLGIILLYDAIQVIAKIFIISEIISFSWIWLPNIVGTTVGVYLLIKKNSP